MKSARPPDRTRLVYHSGMLSPMLSPRNRALDFLPAPAPAALLAVDPVASRFRPALATLCCDHLSEEQRNGPPDPTWPGALGGAGGPHGPHNPRAQPRPATR